MENLLENILVLLIHASGRHGATLLVIWIRSCGHLTDGSLQLTNLKVRCEGLIYVSGSFYTNEDIVMNIIFNFYLNSPKCYTLALKQKCKC